MCSGRKLSAILRRLVHGGLVEKLRWEPWRWRDSQQLRAQSGYTLLLKRVSWFPAPPTAAWDSSPREPDTLSWPPGARSCASTQTTCRRLKLHLFILIALAAFKKVRKVGRNKVKVSGGMPMGSVVVFLRGSCVQVTSYSE